MDEHHHANVNHVFVTVRLMLSCSIVGMNVMCVFYIGSVIILYS
jgi:hypothetical protein